jgi:uncharacterized protein
MAATLGVSLADLIENAERINAIDFKAFEAEAGKFTVSDIREELLKPGRDPRDKFVVAKFREDVKEIADLKEGMELEGTVTNVTNFGAFVDIGVHQDGLVHISELSHKYVQDARQAVKVGDIVKVKVIGVDSGMKRISLSMKAILPKPPRRPRARKKPRPADAPAPAAAGGSARETPEHSAETPRLPPPPRPRPVRKERPAQPQQQQQQQRQQHQPRPPRPVETLPPPKQTTLEEKIRLLQEKFGPAR